MAEEIDQREQLLADIRAAEPTDFILQLPTGFGKCRVAIEVIRSKSITTSILIVVPKLVLINNWKDEFEKWGSVDLLPVVTFTTYISLKKYTNSTFNAIIFDECHHLSDAAYEASKAITWHHSVWLSATMTDRFGYIEDLVAKPYFLKKISVRQAINQEVLPDPKVYLMRMKLDNTTANQLIEQNTDIKSEPQEVLWKDRFKYFGRRDIRYNIRCTQQQYLENLNSSIDYYRKEFMKNRKPSSKNYWLRLCSQRLTYLSSLKEDLVRFMLSKLNGERSVVFCSSIEQSQRVCAYSVNSKEPGTAQQILDQFNRGEINQISTCNMLNEGVNLTNCRYGIYVALNSSEVLIKQKLGRLLRHPNPILMIPFYVGTREEEIVKEMVQDYSPSLVVLRDAPEIVFKPLLKPQLSICEDYDRFSAYEVSQCAETLLYEFMWNDGKDSVRYRVISQSTNNVLVEDTIGNTDLIRSLNSDFSKGIQSSETLTLINRIF